MTSPKERKERAVRALNKKPAYGGDIRLEDYLLTGQERAYEPEPSRLPDEEKQRMLQAGVVLENNAQRGGTFLQVDQSVVHSSSAESGVEVLPITRALESYDWLADYWWKAVDVDADKFTAHVELSEFNGYLIRSLPGAKEVLPVQACLYLGHNKLAQRVHNIVIAEEESELHVIAGCLTSRMAASGLHLGVSEFYVKPRAKLTFTMIHNWSPGIEVRPRSGALVEQGGVFVSNYISIRALKTLQMYPTVRCVGEDSVVRFNSILVAPPDCTLDVGSRVLLEGKGSRAEVISRAVSIGGDVIARGYLEGRAPDVKGHLECRGLLLASHGTIHAVPELKGSLPGIDLSHEAAVGKIAEEEVEYLMARGLTRDEATSTIVRGFLRVEIEGLPDELADEIKHVVESSEADVF
ncbi:MAG: SufD family Fe-S cluster assembly protein [Dehalococcoidia bacterium]|nr:SufD family Fe-S cluster assembly protein [Dehalococcoidia bacterium]